MVIQQFYRLFKISCLSLRKYSQIILPDQGFSPRSRRSLVLRNLKNPKKLNNRKKVGCNKVYKRYQYQRSYYPTDCAIVFQIQKHPKRAKSKTPKKFCPVKRIIGAIGPFVEVEIVFTFGLMLQLWSCRMVQTDGSGLYQMANWPPCIRVDHLKVVQIIQVTAHFGFRDIISINGNQDILLMINRIKNCEN